MVVILGIRSRQPRRAICRHPRVRARAHNVKARKDGRRCSRRLVTQTLEAGLPSLAKACQSCSKTSQGLRYPTLAQVRQGVSGAPFVNLMILQLYLSPWGDFIKNLSPLAVQLGPS